MTPLPGPMSAIDLVSAEPERTQRRVLGHLLGQGGQTDAATIALLLQLDEATVSTALDALLAAGDVDQRVYREQNWYGPFRLGDTRSVRWAARVTR